MVMSGCSAHAARLSGALLKDRMSRKRKTVKLPAAARYHKGPELSAKDASSSPTSRRTGLIPLMALLTPAMFTFDTGEMVASTSDMLCLLPFAVLE